MVEQQAPSLLWQRMIQQSFLSLYSPEANDSVDHQGYDCVFEFANATVYFIVNEVAKQARSKEVNSAVVRVWRQETVNDLMKRHAQLYAKSSMADAKDNETSKTVYFVGLTSLSIQHLDYSQSMTPHNVAYGYGNQFFAEECVLDLDDEGSILQVFSYQSFIDLLKQLATPNELIAFLKFHRHNLTEFAEFKSESALLQTFLQSPAFFEQALSVQNQLVDAKLMAEVDPELTKAVASDQPEPIQTLVKETYEGFKIWNKLFGSLIKRHYEAFAPLPKEQVKILVDESLYTHKRLVDNILAYKEADEVARWSGYVYHQPSYSVLGRYYMVVFYAQDEESNLHASNVRMTHQDMLSALNAQLQSPVMEDLFLIGVSFRPHPNNNSIEVRIDSYHLKGSVVDANTQRLYKQLAELKAKSQSSLSFDNKVLTF